MPKKRAGALVLARYVIEYIDDCKGMPWAFSDDLIGDADDHDRNFEYFILSSIADALVQGVA